MDYEKKPKNDDTKVKDIVLPITVAVMIYILFLQ